ncbi:acyl-CoA dehydrogenase family protein [Mycolicibacterium goodii]|uniref:acyl-CoA dehydrogenase family protein n=1 Tax=Mycolicibacterium goodii TaxID=134601 RepID=UPI00256F21A6|nr:acyl-CoA dehydrogenase family protein [Mycolicibacterium goodii]
MRASIEASVEEADLLGDIPSGLHDELRKAGAFRLLTPRELGGWAAPLPTTLSVYEQFGRIDGSVGLLVWNTNFGFIGAMLPETGNKRIWGTGVEPVFANSGMPGTATPVDGGFRLSGHWKIVTGIRSATWIVVVGIVAGATNGNGQSQAPDVRLFAVPTDQVDIQDTWNVTGLRATGSRDVVIDDVFVPEDLATRLDAPVNTDSPVYRGFIGNLVFGGCAAVTLGIAAHMIEETVTLVRSKASMVGGVVADAARTQYLVAKAQASVDAARLLLLSTAAELADAGDQLTLEQRAAHRAAITHAAEVSRAALVDMYNLAGSSALYRTNKIERIFRDGMAATQHANQSALFMEGAGRVRLGMDHGLPLF